MEDSDEKVMNLLSQYLESCKSDDDKVKSQSRHNLRQGVLEGNVKIMVLIDKIW